VSELKLELADGTIMDVNLVGKCDAITKNQDDREVQVTLERFLYVTSIKFKVFRISKLIDKGYKIFLEIRAELLCKRCLMASVLAPNCFFRVATAGLLVNVLRE